MARVDGLLDGIPLRNAKADLRGVQKLNEDAGSVLDLARKAAQIEPKNMATEMGISHSLVLRGLESKDHLSFHRLWELPDAFWLELIFLVMERKQLGEIQRQAIVNLSRWELKKGHLPKDSPSVTPR